MSQKKAAGRASSRRDFLKTTAVAGSALSANLALLGNVHAAGKEVIKIGLIGCGGRGNGAADNATSAAPNVKITAMGDVFKDRLDSCHKRLSELGTEKFDVPEDRRFVGFDAYKQVISSDVDYVILATPPGFRPTHLEAAVAAGKHIFTEKPVGVDGPGIRKVLQAYETARQKGLCIVAGTQRRHKKPYLEMMKRIHEGAIGDIVAGRCYWNQGALWVHDRQPGWSDMEYHLRNWYHFVWLCGDHIVEQHVHNLDVINWGIQAHPLAAVGMGGREVRKGPNYGQIFDHFAVDYEYPNDVHVMSMSRQIPGCANSVSEALVGTKGMANSDDRTFRIKGTSSWEASDRGGVDPYVQEHTDLIECIRSGKPINELKQVAESTLTAIMGRMSTYTGKRITWEMALNSKENTMPEHLSWDLALGNPPVPVPGRTKFV